MAFSPPAVHSQNDNSAQETHQYTEKEKAKKSEADANANADTEESEAQEAAETESPQPDFPRQTSTSTAEDPSVDETMFYAFLKEDPKLYTGPFYDYIKNKPALQKLVAPRTRLERKFRPMLQWRRWADKHQRFFPSLLFISLTCILCWSIFPTHLQAAAEECKNNFWRSFGLGLLVSIIAMTLLRAVFITNIGWPLGILLAGVFQATILVGLSVALFNLGHSISLLLQITKIKALANKPEWARYVDLFTGSIFAALLLQIPQFGMLPRCGTRLLALFGVLGVGALYRELRNRRNNRS